MHLRWAAQQYYPLVGWLSEEAEISLSGLTYSRILANIPVSAMTFFLLWVLSQQRCLEIWSSVFHPSLLDGTPYDSSLLCIYIKNLAENYKEKKKKSTNSG